MLLVHSVFKNASETFNRIILRPLSHAGATVGHPCPSVLPIIP